jgi:hypothetical protein
MAVFVLGEVGRITMKLDGVRFGSPADLITNLKLRPLYSLEADIAEGGRAKNTSPAAMIANIVNRLNDVV